MILTNQEADTLVGAQHRSPHQLWECTSWAMGRGWWRGFTGRRKGNRDRPVHEKDKPSFKLQQVRPGLFEGSTSKTKKVYAYDLILTREDGSKLQTRDAYSFLPTSAKPIFICLAR